MVSDKIGHKNGIDENCDLEIGGEWHHIKRGVDDDEGAHDDNNYNGDTDDDDDDDGWLKAAGGRDDVNPGVDRLHCSKAKPNYH